MSQDLTAAADQLLTEALEASGARDPRDYYRERLKELKDIDPEKYDEAIEYYRDRLVPFGGSRETARLIAWTEYGKFLAESLMQGKTVSIDQDGLAHPYKPDASSGKLTLHLPQSGAGGRAVLVGLPNELSPAQKATYDVLVSGRHRSSG